MSGNHQVTSKYLDDELLLDSNEQRPMHRIVLCLRSKEQWYGIMRDANIAFGRGNWKTQPRTLRRLKNKIGWSLNQIMHNLHYKGRRRIRGLNVVDVWFEFPELSFVTAMVLKYGVSVESIDNEEQ